MPANIRRRLRFSTASALAVILAFTSIAPTGFPRWVASAQAQAQPQEQIDFDAALEGYGHWIEHPRLGEVWVPDNVPQDWQPYRFGHWVYTDDWGWYWDSDEDFGWVTYHYGRWYFDRELGWVWVPGDEWAPAWVNWRQGDDFVGWAPTPPDEYIDADEDPDAYMFVRAGDMLAPQVYTVFIPYQERRDYYHRSSLVNRTIIFADRRGAVNPGIPPAFIASASGRPFHASHIAPIVLAGTLGVAGAIILRNNFHDRSRTRISVRESDRIYQPGERFQRLPGLNKGERGRFEGNTPRAAQGRNAVLNLGAPAGSQNRQFHRRTNAPQPQTQTDQKQLAPKQFEQKNQPKSFEQKSVPQRNLPQNTQQPKTFQQKTDERRPTSGNDRKRFEDTKRNSEQKGIQQRNLQQKSFQQNNQIQRSPGSNNPPSRLPVQQHSQPQRNLQQNPRPNVQQQRIQQPPRPAPQQAPHPQNSNKNQEKKSQ